MMPWAALLRFLPHIGLALGLLGAVWWIDHQAAERTRRQIEAQALKTENAIRSDLRKSEQRLAGDIATLDGDYAAQRAALGAQGARLQPIIIQEAARDPRYSDPAAGASAGMLDAVNRARATGPCAAAAAGRIVCAVPAAGADPQPGHH